MTTFTLPKADHALRLVTYNIYNGGMGRADPLAETLGWLDGDVVGLTEADDPDMVNYFANRLGYHSAIADDPRHCVALLSRWPIRSAINLKPRCPQLDRTAMEAIVEHADQSLRVLVIHLKAGISLKNEKRRMSELEQLGEIIEPGDDPSVLMGDLNANAPYHPVHPETARKKVRRKLAQQDGVVPHDVIEHLGSLGWTDAYHQLSGAQPKHTLSTGFPGQRVDYIFTSGHLADRLLAADVERDGFTAYCSDHFPLWVDVNIGT